jgi:hypothetical protein
MAEGIILGTGKGNPDWNCSAPHGAGRLMSRTKAHETLSMDEFKSRMEAAGVWSSCVSPTTLDESPMAYKGLDAILSHIDDTVAVDCVLKEVYNFKAEENYSRSTSIGSSKSCSTERKTSGTTINTELYSRPTSEN